VNVEPSVERSDARGVLPAVLKQQKRVVQTLIDRLAAHHCHNTAHVRPAFRVLRLGKIPAAFYRCADGESGVSADSSATAKNPCLDDLIESCFRVQG
jgi:hypothetical protein